jgi:transcriptional regulator
MYQPPHFREEHLEAQHALIRAHPFGLLVSAGPNGLVADPLPFVLDAAASPRGTLRGHLARANPHWRDLDGARESLVVFQGVDHYITPSWYETKRETGKVVPTWNYVMVQAYGTVRVIEDRDWLAGQITELTRRNEARRPAPWAVTDAPAAFVESQIRGIVGLEIVISRLEGKWKLSQNRPERDRQGVIEGLSAADDAASGEMAALVAAATKSSD